MTRGLNPIVAAIMLLLLAVAISSMVYLWMGRMQVSLRESVFGSWSETSQRENARISLENIYCSPSSSCTEDLVLVIKNSGQYDFSNDEMRRLVVYFDDVPAKMYYGGEVHNSPSRECGFKPYLLKIGGTNLINCTTSYLKQEQTTEIRIQMPFGLGDTRSFKPVKSGEGMPN